ncbi:MAG: AraC family transcriptional regulator [Gemmatimonadaceae bacterium]|nr:AraC family transcriptional regulator [Gemmatimonadaceae bacterium]
MSRDELLAAAGLTEEQVASPESSVSLDASLLVWSEASLRTGDSCFGLHAGEMADPLRFGTLGYVIMSSATVRDALAAAIRYERVMYTGFTSRLIVDGDSATVTHGATMPDVPVERQPIEFALATILAVCRRTTGEAINARAVIFRHGPPKSTAEHERVFGVRPTFNGDVDALVLHARVLDRPVQGASAEVLRTLAPVVERLHERVLGDAPHTAAVRTAIVNTLHHEEATVATVAAALITSQRSLQRRLATEHTSFQQVLDTTRKELTLQYLDDPSLSLGEVAFLTGFRDGSAFHRAVRRWTSHTPGQLRGATR